MTEKCYHPAVSIYTGSRISLRKYEARPERKNTIRYTDVLTAVLQATAQDEAGPLKDPGCINSDSLRKLPVPLLLKTCRATDECSGNGPRSASRCEQG